MTLTPVDQFKVKTLDLIAALQLSNEEVVGLGISMAVAHGIIAMVPAAALHKMVDEALAALLKLEADTITSGTLQ